MSLGLLALITLVAGVLNGATAMGFAILTAVGLALVVDAKTAVLLLAVANPVMSGLQLARHRRTVSGSARRTIPLAVGGLVGVPIGASLLGVVDERVVATLLAIMTTAFVVSNVREQQRTIPARVEPFASPLVGLLAGVANGLIGASGPVLGSYLVSLRLAAPVFAVTISSIFFVMGIVRLISLITLGQIDLTIATLGAALLLPALAGQLVGFRLQEVIPRETFRRAILLALTIAAINLFVRALRP